MSSDTSIKLPQASWPFLLDSIKTLSDRAISKAIYDLQLSIILPRQESYVCTGKWFYIRLIEVTSSKITFSIHNSALNVSDIVQCDISTHIKQSGSNTYISHTFTDNKNWLDKNNCFVLFSSTIPEATNLNLLVCASCIMLSSIYAKLGITWGKVHRKGVILLYTKSKFIDELIFLNGYNTLVSYKDNKLIVSIAPGYGKELPFSYSNWILYATLSTESIQGYIAGAKSINGLTGNVYIQPGPSVSIIPLLSGTSLTLSLKANKNTDLTLSQQQSPDLEFANLGGAT